MSAPYDPGRPEDRPSDQPGYPPAPPPEQQYPQGQPPQGGGYAGGPSGGGQFPPAPDYGNAPPPGNAPAYGSAPQYGDPYGAAAPTRGAPPKEVVWATWAMYGAIAVSLLSLLITIVDASGYKEVIREANEGRTAVDIDDLYVGVVVFAVVLTLLISAIYVFLAVNLLKGKNWARITTWVVVGIFTLLGLIGLGGDALALTRLLSIVVLILNAATLVLLALKPSNQYFASGPAPRY